jgi:ligand-binding sensor domain-containing protein
MLRVLIRCKWRIWLPVFLAAGAVAVTSFELRRADQARHNAETAARSASALQFASVAVNLTAPSGIEPVGAPAAFVDFTVYQGHIWMSGPAGLYGWNPDGSLAASYRPGLELPPVELAGISLGLDGAPRLFIAAPGEGLLEFDGHSLRSIRPADAAARAVTCVLALKTGRVIFGTEKHGILFYDGHTIAPFGTFPVAEHVTALGGTEADLWIGTLANGVWHSHAGQAEHFSAPDALPDPQVLSIETDGDAAWIGTPLGVVEYRSGKRIRTLADGYFARALHARGDSLWVGTQDEGILEVPLADYSRPKGTAAARPLVGTGTADLPAEAVERVQSFGGDVLALTSRGLYARRDSRWLPAAQMPGAVLSDRNIAALAPDNSGRLWVGYFDRGLDIVSPALDHVTHHEDSHVFCVNRIVPAPDNQRMAVATANGLVFFDATGAIRQVLGRRQGLIADQVTDVAFSGNRLIAATPAGLSFVASDGIRSIYALQGLVNNHVYSVASDGQQLMAGTLGGVSVIQGDIVRASYTTANSHLRHNWITALAKVDGEWFAGTYGAGMLALSAEGEWHSFSDLKPGFVVNPNALAVSPTRVYAGSLGDGLYIYERAWKRWSRASVGLPSLNVTALAIMGGDLYVGTDNGLVRIPEERVR